jgi:hypothetical protein
MEQWCSDCSGSKFYSEPSSSTSRSLPIDLPLPLRRSGPNLSLVVMPSRAGWWGGWSTIPPALSYGSQLPAEGTGPTCKTPSDFVMVMVGGVCYGRGNFPGHRYLMEVLFSLVPAYGILHKVNGFLPGGDNPMAALWCYLGIFPRHSNAGRWWFEFHTWVRSAKCVWVPTATSHRRGCLKLTPLETWNGWCLSAMGSPGHAEAWVPLSGRWVRRTSDRSPSARA